MTHPTELVTKAQIARLKQCKLFSDSVHGMKAEIGLLKYSDLREHVAALIGADDLTPSEHELIAAYDEVLTQYDADWEF